MKDADFFSYFKATSVTSRFEDAGRVNSNQGWETGIPGRWREVMREHPFNAIRQLLSRCQRSGRVLYQNKS